jgi:two-component system LytT family response regulator
MIKVLLIDDTLCKKELEELLHKYPGEVKSLANLQDLSTVTGLLGHPQNPSLHASGRIAVNTNDSLTLLRVHDIIRCEGDRNYTSIFMTGDRKITVSRTLRDFDDMLGKYGFLRIHKSHLINLNFLEKFVKADGGQAELSDGVRLPVSSRRKEQLYRELIQQNTMF